MERATKGGLGSASARLGSGVVVAALAAVNAGGNVLAPDGHVVAGVRGPGGGFVDGTAWLAEHGVGERIRRHGVPPAAGANTTLAVVATDAVLTKAGASKVAQMAHDGLARAIDPVHTMHDGDTVFALATGRAGQAADVSVVGAVAARVLAAAVVDAVQSATGLAGLPAAAELGGRGPE